MRDIAAHKLEKVYFLEGTEGYFIDKIAEAVTSAALTNDQKDFNQIVYYGADVSVGQIINTAKSYPLGADRLVVEVREAQLVDRLDDLMYYLQYPLDSTILIICYKNGTIDRRKRLAMLVEKQGVLFEAKKMLCRTSWSFTIPVQQGTIRPGRMLYAALPKNAGSQSGSRE